jgi:hypothetical protein
MLFSRTKTQAASYGASYQLDQQISSASQEHQVAGGGQSKKLVRLAINIDAAGKSA